MDSTSNYTSLQPLLFDFNEYSRLCSLHLSEKEAEFASLWNNIVSMLPSSAFEVNAIGRKGYSLKDILAVRVVMLFFRQNNIKQALSFINGSPNVKAIAGMEKVASESVVSRKTKEAKDMIDIDCMFDAVAKDFFKDRLICNLSIDSTPIDARERPIKKERKKANGKRGRRKKGSNEEKEHLLRQAEQKGIEENAKGGDLQYFLSALETRCSITGKKNSKGYMQWRIGYKVHLAVDDSGIPVSYFVSGASVHDSRLAIPLLRMAKQRAEFLYALMDGGYSSKDISDFAHSLGAIAVIDFKANRNGEKKEMEEAKKIRYKARTTVERTNSELKDSLLPPRLYSRGEYSIFDLKLSILMLAMKKMRRVLLKEQAGLAA